METKDWIVLLIPILCNGLIFYFIQWLFDNKREKTRQIRDNKTPYYDLFRAKIDDSLALYSQICDIISKQNIQHDELVKATSRFIDSTKVVFNYYRTNHTVFQSFENDADRLAKKRFELNQDVTTGELNQLREILAIMKDKCINYEGI